MNPEPTYPGLVLVTLTGRAWRWTGSTMVPSKRRGYDVRAEVFSRQCARPGCQELVTAAQTLPSRAARPYQERRQRFVNRRLPDHVRPDQREAERFKPIDIEVRLEGRRGQLELAHCTDHRIRNPPSAAWLHLRRAGSIVPRLARGGIAMSTDQKSLGGLPHREPQPELRRMACGPGRSHLGSDLPVRYRAPAGVPLKTAALVRHAAHARHPSGTPDSVPLSAYR